MVPTSPLRDPSATVYRRCPLPDISRHVEKAIPGFPFRLGPDRCGCRVSIVVGVHALPVPRVRATPLRHALATASIYEHRAWRCIPPRILAPIVATSRSPLPLPLAWQSRSPRLTVRVSLLPVHAIHRVQITIPTADVTPLICSIIGRSALWEEGRSVVLTLATKVADCDLGKIHAEMGDPMAIKVSPLNKYP